MANFWPRGTAKTCKPVQCACVLWCLVSQAEKRWDGEADEGWGLVILSLAIIAASLTGATAEKPGLEYLANAGLRAA